MNIQKFSIGPQFIFGKGSTQEIGNLSIKKAYIICDPFMEKSEMVNKIVDVLKKSGAESKIFSKVVPDPTIEVVSQSVGEIMEYHPDTVIALGGGSAIDTAKAVVKIYSESAQVAKPFVIAVPTTSGTGSENTSFAVISDPLNNEKIALVDESLIPDFALLDTDFTMSVPATVTADAGMDVLTHCLEAYVSSQATDFSDACAEKGLRMTWKYLYETFKNGNNQYARERMHNASSIAGIAFNNAGLGIVHSLSHAMGAFFHVPHGRINTMLLPHVISFNASLDENKETEITVRYGKAAKILHINGTTAKQSVISLNIGISRMAHQMNMPMTLEEMKINREEFIEKIPEMAQRAFSDACTATNPRKVTVEQLEKIYRSL
ncbi:iron-containing alcohol dehydrogenase [Lactococcus lactis]|uniref:1-propanol dehydrogenase PduQ n=1 Tax=Lactococcus lactis TaxID=1358 RepID=UPI002938E06E|nr:1-propanol dehydrogenase PduQ [Lactococcus lactis]WOF40794.1 iron-containing alcohol dehydrogenase [Lactococcus lactis]